MSNLRIYKGDQFGWDTTIHDYGNGEIKLIQTKFGGDLQSNRDSYDMVTFNAKQLHKLLGKHLKKVKRAKRKAGK